LAASTVANGFDGDCAPEHPLLSEPVELLTKNCFAPERSGKDANPFTSTPEPIDVSYVTAVIEVPVFTLDVGVGVTGAAVEVVAFESEFVLLPGALLHAATRASNPTAPMRRPSAKTLNTYAYPRPPEDSNIRGRVVKTSLLVEQALAAIR
jgi:hypothetical protein